MFDTDYKALVIGATGAIGGAFVAAFQSDSHCTHVELVSRSLSPGFDLLNAASIEAQAEVCRASGPYRIIIDATGALTIGGVGPEKSLASLREEVLMENFHINAVAPVLVLRHFAPLLAPGPAVYAKLSARVGSISDNTKGGWYGYRAAKAALNMLLQTAAIELQRKNAELRVVALQPGTVRSNLSKAFASSAPHLLEPAESVAGMLTALTMLTPKSGAHYVDYQGESIAW
ncbi:SDR family NAD(P)-dependent oxidoreductase [Limnohabitans sp.]|jgi:NAD(P)-dependent dehydrogenase (short-subunit alcohol dehydrogenase family)|uniref:SDR family NAD(P)-dependent oxidoreductase n=1 Tax=Limnohabitans sp. TaxID=1907725 RepID=UPI00334109F0